MINGVPEIIRAVDSWWGIMALGIIAIVAIVWVIVRIRKRVRAGSVRVSGDVRGHLSRDLIDLLLAFGAACPTGG